MNERIRQLDTLRGIAVLAILIMNVKGFALIGALYVNPLAAGSLSTSEWILFVIERLFVDYKFIAIFSILFGAGIALLNDKLSNRAFQYQSFRLMALAMIGGLHAFVFWYGDILLAYSICGAVALILSRFSFPVILTTSIIFACVPVWHLYDAQLQIMQASEASILSMVKSFWVPMQENIEAEISGYTGSLGAQFEARLNSLNFMMLYLFPKENFWKSTSLMLIGIALFRSGFFKGKWKPQNYLYVGASAALIGLTITAYGMLQDISTDFSIKTSLNMGRLYLYVGSIPMAIGYASLFYYAFKKLPSSYFTYLADVGRMALTNYLLQTLICTFIFYGWGLGLFGQYNALSLLPLVGVIWFSQLVMSHWWLKRNSHGPVERFWRALALWGSSFFQKET